VGLFSGLGVASKEVHGGLQIERGSLFVFAPKLTSFTQMRNFGITREGGMKKGKSGGITRSDGSAPQVPRGWSSLRSAKKPKTFFL